MTDTQKNSPRIGEKLSALKGLYRIYDEFVASLDLACEKGCTACCTCNGVITTLEGYYILDQITADACKDLFEAISAKQSPKRFRPRMTINRMADLALQEREFEEESADPAWGICPLLEDAECQVYALRPFGCRCLVSKSDCRKSGIAEIDEFVLTVNNLFCQYIEHIDQNGCSGNLSDVLVWLKSDANRETYQAGRADCSGAGLLANRPLPALMIPPEHREQIAPILKAIGEIRLDEKGDASE